MRLLLLWTSSRLSFITGADLGIKIYRRALYQLYAVHYTRNSSEVIDCISSKTSNVMGAINQSLNIISSSVMLIAILVALLSVDPLIAVTVFGGFGLIYGVIIRLTRKRLLFNSQVSAREPTQVIKSPQEGLVGIRDVLIDGTQSAYCQVYRTADPPLRRVQGKATRVLCWS